MMSINWSRFVAWLLPVKMRTGSIHGFIHAFVSGLFDVYMRHSQYDNTIRYRMSHTSQVWSIEKVLNDDFDPILRRIYIDDAGGSVIIPLNPDLDLVPVVLNDDALPPSHVLQADSGYDGGQFDFVVVLPYQFSDGDFYKVKSLVNFYKLAGKRYDIKF